MPATTNSDKFLNAVPRWSGQIGAAGVSSATATVLPLQSTTGLTNGRAYFFTINRLTGTTKNPVSSTEGLVGVINTSTNEITTTLANRGLEGAADAWAAGTLVEILHSAGYMNRFIEGLEVSLNQDGTLKSTALDGTKVYAADAGSTDDYAITLAPAPVAYATGQTFRFKANTANTGPATLNVNALGAKTIKKNYNSDLATGDILANQLVEVIYDGTNFQLLSPPVIVVPTKAAGSDVATGTDDAKYLTAKSLADASGGKMGASWIEFTPTWSYVTPGSGYQSYGRYQRIGKLIYFHAKLVLGTSPTMGALTLAPPVPISSLYHEYTPLGHVVLNDSSTLWHGLWYNTVGYISAFKVTGSYIQHATIASNVPFTWAVGDWVTVSGVYEAA